MSSQPRSRGSCAVRSASGLVFALGVLAGCAADSSTPSALGSQAPDLLTITRGPMLITVRENGELKAANETRIRSQIEGQATLIFLEKEGTVVKKGQKLIELDVSDLREKRATQGISVERARASMVAAKQNLEILGKELKAAEAEAKSKLDIARIDLEKFIGRRSGAHLTEAQAAERISNRELIDSVRQAVAEKPQYAELPDKIRAVLVTQSVDPAIGPEGNLEHEMGELGQQVLEQLDEIKIAQQQLLLDKDKFEKSKGLQAKDYITKLELEQDRLKFESQTSKVTLAWQKLDILISYTLRKSIIDLGLKLDNALLELDKVMASNLAKQASQVADVAAKQSEYDLADERLKNFDEQIQNAEILAPTAGLVVAAEVDDRSRDVVQEGSQVRERQTLLVLPDVTRMIAEVKIQEADVDKVRAGQIAVIQLEAFPDQAFTGRVTRVSPVADSGQRWMSSTRKVYKTYIELDSNNEDGSLRPNMTAGVEIRVGTVPDTIAVPVSAVRRVDRSRYVWKATPSGPKEARVKLGRSTTTQVEILEGVAVGDQIYLAPPPGTSEPKFPDDPADAGPADPVPALPTEVSPGEAMPRGARAGDPSGGNPVVGSPAGGAAPTSDPAAAATGELTREAFQAAVLAKHPEFKAVLESEGMRAWRNEEVRAAIEADPELAAMQATLMEQMRARFGGQGGRGMQGGPGRDGGAPREGGGRRNRGEGGAPGNGAPRDGAPRDGGGNAAPRDGGP
ncbi:MAG: efflux RND transporter periplasmic adaptor subunit [Planctomycetes bacterium]|nr:efflux RND transporter periplasmic adaptor subunit [Planctomycetota bacterium]